MKTNAQQGLLLNVIVGIVGAFVAGLVLTPLFAGLVTGGVGRRKFGFTPGPSIGCGDTQPNKR